MLNDRDIIPSYTLCNKVGDGMSIRFWKDNWDGNGPLISRYNRLYHLDSNANCVLSDRIFNDSWAWNWNIKSIGRRNEAALEAMVLELGQVSLSNRNDAWYWNITDDGSFSVQATRIHIGNYLLPSLSPSTRWSKLLPRKVNVFIWRLILDRLPNRLNLSLRGLDISSIACPLCNMGMESNDHVFFGCDTASSMWRLIRVWTDINMPLFSSWFDWLHWLDNWRASKDSKDRVYVISAASLWVLWRYRNSITFNSHPTRKSDLFDSIRLFSFSWLKFRGHKVNCWNSWLNKPL